MYKQGRSLGRQVSRYVKPNLDRIIARAGDSGVNVWFLGRDCMALFSAYKKVAPNVRYLQGLNRECSRKLQHRSVLHTYLRECGVRDGDILIDSGFRGSIFDRIEEERWSKDSLLLQYYLLSAEDGCAYPSLNCKRSVILALEHSPKPEIVEWDEERRCPVVIKIPATGARSDWTEKKEVALGLNQVSSFLSGFVAGYNAS